MRTKPAISVAVAASAWVGEGPVWAGDGERLHWVDVLAGAVHTSALHSGTTTSLVVPTMVGAAVPRPLGGFVAAVTEGFGVISEDGALDVRRAILDAGSRMNDAKCDARGRLWAGSTDMEFRPGGGALQVLEPDWSTRMVLDGLTLPNGMGWSPSGDTFYLIDSMERTLNAYAFDVELGRLSEPRVLHRFDPDEGFADGMCVDAAGRLWIAMWGAGRLRCLSSSGEDLLVVDVPVQQPSSCAFGGPQLTRLMVTTARQGLESLDPGAVDGSVLVLDGLGTAGLPPHFFAG